MDSMLVVAHFPHLFWLIKAFRLIYTLAPNTICTLYEIDTPNTAHGGIWAALVGDSLSCFPFLRFPNALRHLRLRALSFPIHQMFPLVARRAVRPALTTASSVASASTRPTTPPTTACTSSSTREKSLTSECHMAVYGGSARFPWPSGASAPHRT